MSQPCAIPYFLTVDFLKPHSSPQSRSRGVSGCEREQLLAGDWWGEGHRTRLPLALFQGTSLIADLTTSSSAIIVSPRLICQIFAPNFAHHCVASDQSRATQRIQAPELHLRLKNSIGNSLRHQRSQRERGGSIARTAVFGRCVLLSLTRLWKTFE